jgi:hypothetical protein
VSRTGHDIGRGDPTGASLRDMGVANIDGIEHADVGLNGGARVPAFGLADVTMRIDQSWHDDLAGDIDPGRAIRNFGRGRGADRENSVLAYNEDAGIDLRSGDRYDFRASKRDGSLRERKTGQQENEKCNRTTSHEEGPSVTHRRGGEKAL